MAPKYQPLEDHLKSLRTDHAVVTLSMAQIETIIGSSLPRSAFTYREWWSNQSDVSNRPQAKAWIDAGYRVDSVQQRQDSGSICFMRQESAPAPPKASERSETTALPTAIPGTIEWNPDALIEDFIKVAALSGVSLRPNDIIIDAQPAPHKPSSLPAGHMAVYVFLNDGRCLKVGKAGPKSGARFVSQHYNPSSSGSNLAKSLLADSAALASVALDASTVGPWIRNHCARVNFLLDAEHGMAVPTLLEAFLQCRLRPRYEGFKSQQA